ncbi:hypothetical protein NQ315_005255 [Exocentrus adspersus]|uniref:Uncharacterized protein n=1 Tax=Exocentrus adspersus TaxID=1586481 RepID=A0AAV8W1P8_9CUCU|nr:hypothetical protein NQ315_005255 [Exocentrus adspersus]
MKYFCALFFVAAVSAGRLQNVYLPPSSSSSAGGSSSFLSTPLRSAPAAPTGLYNAPSSGPTSPPAAILRLNNDNNGDGTYSFDFETENRITQQETGQVRGAGGDAAVVAQGSYSFVAPDGQSFTVNYVADENGFQPQGAHLPVAPPVPAEILKALEQNAADEAAGIVDDGQYRPDPSEGAASRQYLAPRPTIRTQQSGGYRY